MFNVQQITSRLSMMSDEQLAQYARMHKDDPYILPMASAEAKRRQQDRLAATGQQAAQAGQKPTIADQNIASMQLPEDQGIGVLPAQNIEGMADGGIAGYAEGGVAGYATGGVPQSEREKYRAYALRKAREMGLDPRFVDGIFQIESGYDPTAKSKTGPEGIGQLAKKTGLTKGLKPEERKDPYKNMDAAMALMKDFFNKYKDPAKVAIAYNQGEGVLNDHLKKNKGKLVPEKLYENVRTRNKQEPLNYLKKLNNYIPIPAAAAADMPPRGEAKVSPPSGAPAARGVAALPTLPKEPVAAAPTSGAPAETGIANLPKRDKFVDPLAKQREQLAKESTLPSGREVGSAVAATGDYLYNLLPFALGEAGYGAGRMFGVSEENAKKVPEFFAGFSDPLSRFFKTKDTPEDRAALTRKIEKFVGENIHKGAEWIAENSEKYTSAPISVRDAENLMNISALALGAKGKGKGKAEPAPATGVAEAKSRIADAEAAAATAAENAKTAAAPRLEGPKAKPSRAFELQQRLAEAQERAARASETAGLMATSVMPDGRIMTGAEKAAALRASIEPPKQFTPDPAAQQLGVQALLERNRRQQSKDVRRAQEAAEAADRKATEIKALEEKRIAAAEAVPRTITSPFAPRIRPRTATAAVAGGRGEAIPAVPEIEYPNISENMYSNEPPKPEAEITPDKLEAAKELGQQVLPKSEGFSNEDILTMGLNMLMAPAGQPGGALSQLGANLGRSGLATLGARRERELRQQEKDYKDVMKGYYGKLTEMYGRPEAEERQIAQIIKENPGMFYDEAVERLYSAKYASRGDTTLEAARLRNPFLALYEQGLMAPSGDLTPAGQSVFYKYFPKQ